MKNKIKKWHIALMSFIALFIAVFASLFSLRADTVDEETGEVLTDNWELGIVFYDSTVDNGKTPLTEINWDASNGGYGEGTPRIITVQINYKNTSAVTTYQPGELVISIPNLIYSNSNSSNSTYKTQWDASAIVGANNPTHTGYDWNFVSTYSSSNSPTRNQSVYKFTNANTIEEKSNFEGSIQIQYTITPAQEHYDNVLNPRWEDSSFEGYIDECTHTYSKNLTANLSYNKTSLIDGIETSEKVTINSNTLSFNYTRTYYHPWTKIQLNLTKSASKISAYDGLGDNPSDYIWVNYTFSFSSPQTFMSDAFKTYDCFPKIKLKSARLIDVLPEGCVAFDNKLKPINLNNNTLEITVPSANSTNVFVGYPKSIYNEEAGNLNIINTAQIYGVYATDTEETFLAEDDVSLNLANYEFSYSGNLYGIQKIGKHYTDDSVLYYQNLVDRNEQAITNWDLLPTVKYTGTPLTVRIGDDLLFSTNKEGNSQQLTDNDYYFSYISFPKLYNNNSGQISPTKYSIRLFVRYAGATEYVQYGEPLTSYSQTFTFNKDDKVVGFYFQIDDMKEGIKTNSINYTVSGSAYPYSYIRCKTILNPTFEIDQTGTVYNFGYLNVFSKDENGSLVLLNEPALNNYNNTLTQHDIAAFDMETYGHYMQRSFNTYDWIYYEVPSSTISATTKKTAGAVTQDEANELFSGSFTIYGGYYSSLYEYNSYKLPISKQYIFEQCAEKGIMCEYIHIEDLLPEGITLTSTKEEILLSMKINGNTNNAEWQRKIDYKSIYNLEGNNIFSSNEEILPYVMERTTLTIYENYENTNRTKIDIYIDFSDEPLIAIRQAEHYATFGIIPSFDFNYIVSYDSFLEFGNVYTNQVTTTTNTTSKTASATAKITSVVSTHQDVTTYVKTDQSNYSTGIVDTSCDSEYEYKLRVRTGSADVTNLVIYTSIEEAQPKKTRWKGEFLGIDTTYAENKGYTVKVWYSPNTTVGTLTEDTSWQVYDEATVDKSKVKSLAFQYLVETDDTTGTSIDAIDPAVLPANSLTYVLIKMKSPADENIKTLARMDCWTQWNALDDYDRPVDFITGINSNVVKVALPNSVKTDDLPSISLKFTKEIQGETSDFENLKLNKANEHVFMIRLTSLTQNDDGTYNQVTGLLSSTQGLVITQIPIGTYLLEELGDNYFDFVEFTNNNDPEIIIEGVTFEKTDQGYIITVSEDLAETIEFNIKVTNKTEDKRFYEDKNNKENLFLINKTGIDHNVPEE